MTPEAQAREKIVRIVRENPRQTATDIAAKAGVTKQRASQILKSLGYELVYYWRRRPGK
jgi:predicted transcriptional regulator